MAKLEHPPGWYADPARRHEYRYWDGNQWAEQVSDAGTVSSDAPDGYRPAPPDAEAPPRPSGEWSTAVGTTEARKSSAKRVVWLAVLACVLVAIGVGGFAVAGAANRKKSDYAAEQAALDSTKQTPQSAQRSVDARFRRDPAGAHRVPAQGEGCRVGPQRLHGRVERSGWCSHRRAGSAAPADSGQLGRGAGEGGPSPGSLLRCDQR